MQLFLSVGSVAECLNLRRWEGWTETKKTRGFDTKVLVSPHRRGSWKIADIDM